MINLRGGLLKDVSLMLIVIIDNEIITIYLCISVRKNSTLGTLKRVVVNQYVRQYTQLSFELISINNRSEYLIIKNCFLG